MTIAIIPIYLCLAVYSEAKDSLTHLGFMAWAIGRVVSEQAKAVGSLVMIEWR